MPFLGPQCWTCHGPGCVQDWLLHPVGQSPLGFPGFMTTGPGSKPGAALGSPQDPCYGWQSVSILHLWEVSEESISTPAPWVPTATCSEGQSLS